MLRAFATHWRLDSLTTPIRVLPYHPSRPHDAATLGAPIELFA